MKPVWAADTEISTDLVLQLLQDQFPELNAIKAELIGEGWDNSAYLIDGTYLFRFPRRVLGASLLANEMRILPAIAKQLSLPVSSPVWAGVPAHGYPYPFAGYRLIPGSTACSVTWTDEARHSVAADLGTFLKALHGIEISPETAAWAPGDEIRRTDLQLRVSQLKERLHALDATLKVRGIDGDTAARLAEELSSTPRLTDRACWVHGDLYARHLLVANLNQNTYRLCGVIDWGDVHLGDRALDLSIAFSFLPPSAHGVFLRFYGAVDEGTWRRAQFRALHYGAILMLYGAEVGDNALETAGEYALKNALGNQT